MRLLRILAILVMSALVALPQATTTSTLSGMVTDPQGAVVVGAQITVTDVNTGRSFNIKSDIRGQWVIPSMPTATYRVTVTMQGFKTTTIENVKIDAGVPATANTVLELGALAEVVEVTAGAEIVQTTTASLNSTLQGRQVYELPYISRNALDLLVTQAGTQTTGTNRNTFINGLPFSSINISTDGINTQDNYYRSGDGFFTLIPVRQDSIEEVTLTTSAAGADSSAQGAAQVKFITRGGSNQFHGGSFWQHRNTALNANYYFNNIDGLPRDRIILNQGGVHVGGPVLKNKLFFFSNFEIYRLPATSSATRTVLAPSALNGDYTYKDSSGAMHTVNVLSLAGGKGFPSTQDPIIQQTLQKIDGLTKNGTLKSRVPSSSDYNRNDLVFQPGGMGKNYYDTTRLDYQITDKHQLQFVWTYFKTDSTPDITNSIVPIYPGTGTVLGYDNLVAGQRGNRYAGMTALRSSFRPTLTNEFRAGMNRSITMFRDQISSPALFSVWKGYAPYFGTTTSNTYLTGVASVTGSSRRTTPIKEIHDTLSWLKGNHLLSAGADFTRITFWAQAINTTMIPRVFFGMATNDPINTGSTNIFTNGSNGNFPGATSTQLTEAASLYAILTGRVSSIGRDLALNGSTHQYANVPVTDLDRMEEWGTFLQDTWKVRPSLTLTLGLRFEQQGAFQNLDKTYSSVSLASVWGISGIGNLFKPGTMTGITPTFDAMTKPYQTPSNWNPSIGLAWQLPQKGGLLGRLFGNHQGASVLRAGYNISTVREGMYVMQSIYGSNQGVSISASVDPSSYATDFGAPGSVLFRNATLPVRSGLPTQPSYPMAVKPSNSLNAFDPNLKMGYVQSWNIGFQREVTKDTVVEVRYTGNHGVKEWRQINLNEVNTFENGFQKEFYIAQNNLFIAQRSNPNSVNFGNQGLTGQQDIPILKTALGFTSDTNTATYLRQNRPGDVAYTIYRNSTRMANLTKAGYPANFFIVNPDVPTGGAYIVTNGGSSYYNALQVEVRRRMAQGLMMQGSYVWAHSLVNGATSDLGVYSEPTTFRNTRLDRVPTTFDIRHAFKLNSIYELPFGPGRRFASTGFGNPVVKKVFEGWQVAGVSRIQSGAPWRLTTGRYGMNTMEPGVVLYNMTAADLQKMMKLRKVTGSDGKGQVFYLPQDFIDNTLAALELGGKNWSNLDWSKPFIGPQLAPGQFGNQVFLRAPAQYHLDMSLVKITRIYERASCEFRANFLDALNVTNFFLASTTNININSSFGQTRSAYRDFAGSGDPGARMIEFQLRFNF